jgi:hypothetical protein
MEKVPEHLKYAALTEKILKIFYQVYNELGFGFLEAVYENAMAIALIEAGIKVAQQAIIDGYKITLGQFSKGHVGGIGWPKPQRVQMFSPAARTSPISVGFCARFTQQQPDVLALVCMTSIGKPQPGQGSPS